MFDNSQLFDKVFDHTNPVEKKLYLSTYKNAKSP